MLALSLLINGIELGAMYALMAIGFAIIFGSTRIFHYAHAASYAIAAYVYYALHVLTGWPWWAAIPPACAACVCFGVAIDRFVYRAIQRDNAAFFTTFIASFGVTIVVINVITLIFGGGIIFLSSPLTVAKELGGGVVMSWFGGIVIVLAVVLFGVVQWFLRNTDTGLALRALNESPELVQAYGLRPRRLALYAFAVGSALVAPAAIASLYIQGLIPASGERIVLISIAATIIGGVGSLRGAGLGGLLLGLAESLSSWRLPTAWGEATSFIVLLVFILVWPSGLFGRTLRV